MQKIISLLFSLLLINSIVLAEESYKVIATASIFADMAKNIAGDKLDIGLIVPVGGDPHLHEPTPRDAQLVSKAELILMNGLTFEGWLNKLVKNSGTNAKTVLITKGVNAIKSLDYNNSFDPHAWMDASNGLFYIKNIKDALVEYDPANKDYYEKNYEVYKKEIEALDIYIKKQIESIPAKSRTLITSHDAFQYYGRRYNLALESVLGISTDEDVQTSSVSKLNKLIKENNIPAVFIESTINPKLLKQIASDTGVKIGGELFADSLGDEDSPANSYVNMLRHNTDVITNALKGNSQVAIDHHTANEVEQSSSSNMLMYGIIACLFLGGFFFVFRKLNNT